MLYDYHHIQDIADNRRLLPHAIASHMAARLVDCVSYGHVHFWYMGIELGTPSAPR